MPANSARLMVWEGWVYGESMYLEWRYGVCSQRGSMRMVELGVCDTVELALVIACSMARRMHSWSYSGLTMLVPCQVCGALLPLDEKTISSGYSECLSGRCGSGVIC
jgi:hypothetical protein